MKEIGGYLELDKYNLPMLHDKAIKLNCARNALAYIVRAKNITKILMPKLICDSCINVLKKHNVTIRFYSIGLDFEGKPVKREHDEWLYVVNYYGQLSSKYLLTLGEKVIVDNSQAYFQQPINGLDTLYTCRKFFGVADGAFLYTDKYLEGLERDESYERIRYLMGRYERTAVEFYGQYRDNEKNFTDLPLKFMSRLTENMLHAVNYEKIRVIRTANFEYLHQQLYTINKLKLNIPTGAFMYPLYIEKGNELRKKLQDINIYIPILWPYVFDLCKENELEYDMAKNILPLPVDQRYGLDTMVYLIEMIQKLLIF